MGNQKFANTMAKRKGK